MALIIAHRGFSAKYPENTLLSIKKAIDLGVDGIECDIRNTKDKKLVLFHDRSLKRMTGVEGNISDKAYSEIHRLWVRGIEKIPLMSQALKLMKKMRVNHIILEIKTVGFEKEIIKEIVKKNIVHRVVISSRSASSLQAFRLLNKDIRLAYIMDNRLGMGIMWKRLHSKIALHSVNHFHRRALLTRRFIRNVKKNGLKDMVWFTLHYWDESWMRALLEAGVDGIITDYPDRLIAVSSAARNKAV